MLADELDLEKAALLLPDYDDDVYVPWASTGLDATSIHRLRIPADDVHDLVNATEAGVAWVGEPAQEFAPYFSRREAAMLDHLLVFPLVDDGEPRAVLIVTESSFFEEFSDSLSLILAAVSEPAAQTISRHRLTYEQIMRQAIAFKPAEIGIVADRVAARVSEARVLSIDLADVVAQISTSAQHIDSFRVWEDVIRVLASLFASSGSVCDARDHRAIVVLHAGHEEDSALIVHHCAASLRHYLPELKAVPVLRYSETSYPADGASLPDLIGSML